MKKIIIVGAGPAGLFLANRLRKSGYEDVTVVDTRDGVYTRHGSIDTEIFARLKFNLEEDVQASPSRHIKDVERSLSKIANSLGVKFINGSFIGFEANGIKVKKGDGSIETIPCDLAIDATGSKRVLINEINKHFPGTFTETPLKGATDRKHLVAYVNVSAEDLSELENSSKLEGDKRVNALEQLRNMGWDDFVEPYFEFRIISKTKNKVCFYTEIPQSVKQDQYQEWLQKVVELETGMKDLVFAIKKSKYKNKVRINTFPLYPHKLNRGCFKGNNVVVNTAAVGDSLADPDYRKGVGIKNAIYSSNNLIESMKMDNDKNFEFDFDKYEQNTTAILEDYEEELETYYAAVRDNSIRSLKQTKKEYQTAVDCAIDVDEADSLQFSFDMLSDELARKLYEDACEVLNEQLDSTGEIKLDNGLQIENEDELNKSINLLNDALIESSSIGLYKMDILQKIEEIALKYKSLGDKYFHIKKYGFSNYCYDRSSEILETFFSDNDRILISIYTLAANKIHTLLKLKNYKEAVQAADDLQGEIDNLDPIAGTDKLYTQVSVYRTIALLNLWKNLKTDARDAAYLKNEATILDLLKNPNIKEKNAKQINKLLTEITDAHLSIKEHGVNRTMFSN